MGPASFGDWCKVESAMVHPYCLFFLNLGVFCYTIDPTVGARDVRRVNVQRGDAQPHVVGRCKTIHMIPS